MSQHSSDNNNSNNISLSVVAINEVPRHNTMYRMLRKGSELERIDINLKISKSIINGSGFLQHCGSAVV